MTPQMWIAIGVGVVTFILIALGIINDPPNEFYEGQ